MTIATSAFAVLLLLTSAGPARVVQQIRPAGLPTGVQAAVQREQAAGADIKSVAAEKENGKTVYEIETMVRGHSRDLTVDATGHVIQVEEEVPIDTVPATVKTALEARGNVTKLEMITNGATVTYEAQIEKSGKHSEVVVNAAGARMKG
jgi:uncharacterized membrane protein YkoI